MNKINIKFLKEEVLESLKNNQKFITKKIYDNQDNNRWIYELYGEDIYETKKYYIDDFNLSLDQNGEYSNVDFQNSILLYETLKDLPAFILSEERFWLWILLEKGYAAALQAMPIKPDSKVFSHHWLFSGGNRRGLMYGVLSRCFFRVKLSIDNTLEDKYELTRYVIEKPERFRNLTWRSYSNNKKIILGVLKGQKKAVEELKDEKTNLYKEISKYISQKASTKLIDVMEEKDFEDFAYYKYKELLNDSN
ncbi:MAG TPA: hypothetical protein DHS57_05765 [Erysipelotrichaceae bacterium]|nr:hypothetical protein [Erysipelotrichaceae bacterium]HCY06765.1 hypothetical protein [Erysipelotrichaceae bacterium]